MGWSLGYDDNWQRDIGYGVPAYCDEPGCKNEINRGLSYVCCGESPYGGSNGCGRYFCFEHQAYILNDQDEVVCGHKNKDYISPDHPDWTHWKATDESWKEWRNEN